MSDPVTEALHAAASGEELTPLQEEAVHDYVVGLTIKALRDAGCSDALIQKALERPYVIKAEHHGGGKVSFGIEFEEES